ncbi:MAG: hypothetical protein ACK51V_00340, partial [bacterium]
PPTPRHQFAAQTKGAAATRRLMKSGDLTRQLIDDALAIEAQQAKDAGARRLKAYANPSTDGKCIVAMMAPGKRHRCNGNAGNDSSQNVSVKRWT